MPEKRGVRKMIVDVNSDVYLLAISPGKNEITSQKITDSSKRLNFLALIKINGVQMSSNDHAFGTNHPSMADTMGIPYGIDIIATPVSRDDKHGTYMRAVAVPRGVNGYTA
jgi:hypothetical protein